MHSHHVRPGDVFVAVTGATCDGHDFASEAIRRGAKALLVERLLPCGDVPTCVVPDTRNAFGRLCQALAGDPSRQMKVIGVTGTNGKSTTVSLIASVLRHAGARPGVLGSLGYFDGVSVAAGSHTTPPAPVLADWLARMAANGCSHAVVEVSSHALSQSRLSGIEFDAVCVTNVRRDHLDYHGSVQNYRRTKARLLDLLSPSGAVVLNADDPVCAHWLSKICGPVLTVGIESEAELTATVVEREASEQTFLITAGCDTIPVRTRMIGDHHIANCLTAAALGLIYGIELTTAVRGLEAVRNLPGRMERIDCGQPYLVVVDYAHTPDALAAVLGTLRYATAGRLICVFGAGGDRDRQKRAAMGSAVESLADVAIITSDNPRGEDPWRIAQAIRRGFELPERAQVILDREKAIYAALRAAGSGDCVLIAGKGHETHQVIGRHHYPFDDREVARRWFAGAGSMMPKVSIST
jgi:UDP-N-acetylmuramoyl-L-alanyl-D-glutamate--2,6-diaminopimelate ligase